MKTYRIRDTVTGEILELPSPDAKETFGNGGSRYQLVGQGADYNINRGIRKLRADGVTERLDRSGPGRRDLGVRQFGHE